MTTSAVPHHESFVNHTESPTTQAQSLGELVVGVDGTQESFAALQWALQVASDSGQKVHAVYGWANSWDKSAQSDDDAWKNSRHEIAQTLRTWVEEASEHIDFNPENLQLTSVKASGSQALLQIGAHAQQIVVGRRTIGRIARWFFGSLSNSLIAEAQVPVTVVRCDDDIELMRIQDAIEQALNDPTPLAAAEHNLDTDTQSTQQSSQETPQQPSQQVASSQSLGAGALTEEGQPYSQQAQSHTMLYKGQFDRAIVVGVDGSKVASKALQFAALSARIEHRPLHVMFFWQFKDLAALSHDETTIPSLQEGQAQAEHMLDQLIDKAREDGIFTNVQVYANAFHISAAKGLITASQHANRIIVGSRGLSALDAHVLGSVSKQIIDTAQCTVTVVH